MQLFIIDTQWIATSINIYLDCIYNSLREIAVKEHYLRECYETMFLNNKSFLRLIHMSSKRNLGLYVGVASRRLLWRLLWLLCQVININPSWCKWSNARQQEQTGINLPPGTFAAPREQSFIETCSIPYNRLVSFQMLNLSKISMVKWQ